MKKIAYLSFIALISSCVANNNVSSRGKILTLKDLYLTRYTNYKNENEYSISRFNWSESKVTDKNYTLGKIKPGTLITYEKILFKRDLYLGGEKIFKGIFIYNKIPYKYEASFYESEESKYIKILDYENH